MAARRGRCPRWRTRGRRRPDRGRPPWRAPPIRARSLGRLRPAPRRRPARRAAVHPRHPPVRLPLPAVDDADVRGLRRRRGHQRAVQVSCSPPGQTGLSIAYDMPTLYGYDTDDPEAEGEFGTCGVGVSSLADMEVLLDGLPLDRVSTSMTINSPAAPIWAMYIVAAEKAGFPRAALEGTTPERHPQGVHRPEGVPVPARAVDAPRDRHDRVRDARDAALEHDLDLRLPHPRGRLDRRPGAGVHDRRRHGLRRGGDRARAARRRLRAAAVLLLQLAQRLLRGDRQVPGVAADLVQAHDRALPRRERALDLDALPHPDRGRLAHAAAAAEQPHPRRDPGPRGGARRDAVAPHRRVRRGARRADRRGRAARPPPAAGHRRGDRRRRTRSTRSAARGSSSR